MVQQHNRAPMGASPEWIRVSRQVENLSAQISALAAAPADIALRSDISALIAQLQSLQSRQQQLIDLITSGQNPGGSIVQYGAPEIKRFSLTTERATPEQVTFAPADVVQFVCDGPMDGIVVYLGDTSSSGMSLGDFNSLPVTGLRQLYWENALRPGRSYLQMVFSRSQLSRVGGGDPVSGAELAVRLGSPVRFDRRGEVVWYDTFSSPGEGELLMSGASLSDISLTTALALNGALSRKVTAGADPGDEVYVYKQLEIPALTRSGIEVAMSTRSANPSISAMFYVGIRAVHGEPGTLDLNGSVSLDLDTKDFKLLTSQGVWTTVGNIGNSFGGEYTFNNIKLVVDFKQKRYVRLLVNHNEYDLSSYGLAEYQISDTSFAEYSFAWVNITDVLPMYMGNMIATQREP